MGFIDGIGGGRQARLNEASYEANDLVSKLQSGYVYPEDLREAGHVVGLVRSAMPNSFWSLPYDRMVWADQMRGAENLYGQVQNAVYNRRAYEDPGIVPNRDPL